MLQWKFPNSLLLCPDGWSDNGCLCCCKICKKFDKNENSCYFIPNNERGKAKGDRLELKNRNEVPDSWKLIALLQSASLFSDQVSVEVISELDGEVPDDAIDAVVGWTRVPMSTCNWQNLQQHCCILDTKMMMRSSTILFIKTENKLLSKYRTDPT